MWPNGCPTITNIVSGTHGKIFDRIHGALSDAGSTQDPSYYIGVAEVFIQKLEPPVSWTITLVDLGGKVWESTFMRPEDRPVERKSRYERPPVI
jgi:hypothetical protein